jgi:hypothetical protein
VVQQILVPASDCMRVWDVQSARDVPLNCGFRRGLEDKYAFGRTLGEGGFGVVRVVRAQVSWLGLQAVTSGCRNSSVFLMLRLAAIGQPQVP